MQFTKLSTLLSVVILGAITAPGAYAGEAYVTNTDRNSWGHTTTDVNVESKDWSYGHRNYAAYAEKFYIDGDIGVQKGGYKGYKPTTSKVSFDQFTVHTAASQEFGHEHFGSDSETEVKVWSFEQFDESSHTSAAGVR